MAGVKWSAWSFEKEARFFTTITSNPLNIESLFYELTDEFFNDIIITINPFLSNEENEQTINELKKMLSGYSVLFADSELVGKIRI